MSDFPELELAPDEAAIDFLQKVYRTSESLSQPTPTAGGSNASGSVGHSFREPEANRDGCQFDERRPLRYDVGEGHRPIASAPQTDRA